MYTQKVVGLLTALQFPREINNPDSLTEVLQHIKVARKYPNWRDIGKTL